MQGLMNIKFTLSLSKYQKAPGISTSLLTQFVRYSVEVKGEFGKKKIKITIKNWNFMFS